MSACTKPVASWFLMCPRSLGCPLNKIKWVIYRNFRNECIQVQHYTKVAPPTNLSFREDLEAAGLVAGGVASIRATARIINIVWTMKICGDSLNIFLRLSLISTTRKWIWRMATNCAPFAPNIYIELVIPNLFSFPMKYLLVIQCKFYGNVNWWNIVNKLKKKK